MLPKGLLKEYSNGLSMLIRSLDVVSVIFAGLLAYVVKFENLDAFAEDRLLAAIILLLVSPLLLFIVIGVKLRFVNKNAY